MCESSMAFETRPEIESSLLSASVLILSCFLGFRVEYFLSFVDHGGSHTKQKACGCKDDAYWYADTCGQSGDGSDL